MENKYYTPTTEEFHVGFEFEVKDFSREDGWLKMSHNYLAVGPPYICFEKNPEGEIIKEYINDAVRVKYLDEEDIEEFGFTELTPEQKKEYSFAAMSRCSFIRITDGDIKETVVIHIIETRVVICKLTEKTLRGYNDKILPVIFIGDIKNKSELKKLMKQLNIQL